MILYLDTSALVKLYIDEDGQDVVLAALGAASMVTTSAIAYVEARSAFARRWREGDLDDAALTQLAAELDGDWSELIRLSVSEPLARHAGELAQMHALRGFDAIHLASALQAHAEFGSVRFLAFDDRLTTAARNAGLALVPSEP